MGLSASGVELFGKAAAEHRIAKREAQSRQAVYAAEGGMEWAKSMLKANPDWTGGITSVAGNQVQVSSGKSGGGYWITTSARSGLAQRKIKVYLKLNAGKWSVTHYQELHD